VNTAKYAELFQTEGREHLSAINHSLLSLERGDSAARFEAVATIFRAVHTIKGMSATMGYAAVAELAHEMETLLDRIRGGDIEPTPSVIDTMFKAADALERGIEASVAGRAAGVDTGQVLSLLRTFAADKPVEAERGRGEATGGTWTVAAPAGAGTLVRVRLSEQTALRGVRAFMIVNALRRLGGVSVVAPSVPELQSDLFDHDFALRIESAVSDAEVERIVRGCGDVVAVQVGEDAEPAVARLSDSLKARPSGSIRAPAPERAAENPPARRPTPRGITTVDTKHRHVRIELGRLDTLMNLIGELVVARVRLGELTRGIGDGRLAESVNQTSRLIGDLRDEIMHSRMVPVWQVFDRFPRLVRDASRGLGKQVDFVVEGKEIELDRSMLDEMGEPIVHLLRNAVDHGIETPDRRVASGKPAAGRLLLSAERDRSAVVIRVSDDGQGIDRERVLARAKESGLVDAAKTELTDDELVRTIARPGFSTAEKVTEVSGRGVGVDAVYTRVRALGGSVDLRSVPGRGTTVTLRLPLTLAILRAILARVDQEQYAIPITHVSETVEVLPEAVQTLRGKEVLMVREDVLPLIRLRNVVGLPPAILRELEQAVIIRVADRRAALVVDDLIGQQDIVVKQVDQVRDGLRCFSGATILSDGAPALILDVGSLS
jgi:two-component system chemotaxis sensor kinase CheA